MVNESDNQKAIDDLDSQEAPNYSSTARIFSIDRKTLQRRHQAMSRSIQQAHSESLQLLTDAQEAALIQHINDLSDRGLPPHLNFSGISCLGSLKSSPERTG
ncbi:hypothetical protein K469DRAFT_781248 [Zopfia rhizophila CBS 207.26]|uniref:Uncharacterized protein n=1 Tax=Zopfia rhizophila CBS 207.26 TaxID=1314779 RepID=A0A6A6E0X5_9PEZI|nr:hypothetical protein K469DRAFT_781248 [Zopfia rhizophila CBS 207.26]